MNMQWVQFEHESIAKSVRNKIKGTGASKWHELSDILMHLFMTQATYEEWYDFNAQQAEGRFDEVPAHLWYLKLTPSEWIEQADIDVSETTMRSHLKKLHTLGLVSRRICDDGVAEYRCDTEDITEWRRRR